MMHSQFTLACLLAITALPVAAAPVAPSPLAAAESGAQAPDTARAWWHMFGDPDLATLVDRAMAANLDIEQAAARLDRAAAAAGAVRAALLPSIGANASAAALRQSLEDPAIRPFAGIPGFPRAQERYSAGISASWEIDLFGSGARRRGARATMDAAAADLAGARIAIAAETATSWLTVREYQARRLVLRAQLSALAEQQAIARRRIAAGAAAPVEADRIAGERASQAGAVALLDGLIAAEVERLGVLVADAGEARARAAGAADAPFSLQAPATEQLQVSIAARPDVVAAGRRLAAADAALAVARSARTPRVSLAGLLASIATTPVNLFTGAAQSAQGSAAITLPLLDFGRIDAAIAEARGSRREALASARKAELDAAADVARSAALLDSRQREAAAQQEAFDALSQARNRIGAAYGAGSIDLDQLLDVERGRLAAQAGAITAQAGAMKALVAVFRATADMPLRRDVRAIPAEPSMPRAPATAQRSG